MPEKELASATIVRGVGGIGRGRGLKGRGRGKGDGRPVAARGGGRGRGDQRSAGGRGGNHDRHSRQPAKSPNKEHQGNHNQGGKGRGGRSRPSSYNDKSVEKCTIKKSGPYAHLFCSERHAFALSRVFYPRNDDQFLLPSQNKTGENTNNHRIASDHQFEQWWEAVKFVRCHVPLNETADTNNSSFLERCPICLDEELVSPFIAPCGHAFCLPCVLGYLNSVTNDLNAESERIHKTKQHFNKKGSGVVGSCDLTARASVTSIRARCPMCSSGSATELNVGDAMITYKDLRPVMFVPVMAITAASAGEAKKVGGKGKKIEHRKSNSSQPGTQMKFVKLHRTKQCPAPYLPISGHCVRGSSPESWESTPEQGLPDLPDGDNDKEECVYSRQYFVGLEEYDNVLQRYLDDLVNYRENTIHCQMDPREDWNVSMAVESIQAAQRRWMGSIGDDGGFRRIELDAKLADVLSKQGDQKLLVDTRADIDKEGKPHAKGPKNSALLQPGSFHLHNIDSAFSHSQGEADEFLYYISSDGQPCYLSGINVACLIEEFSLYETKDDDAIETQGDNPNQEDASLLPQQQQNHGTPNKPRCKLPLPDEISGTVVEIEHLTVTKSLIKRKPFLSHMPLTSPVSFVEIDFYSSGNGGNKPMLSHGTLSKFRGELQRRKSDRLRTAKLEQKADKVARSKSEKEEHRRRRELLGQHYLDGGSRQTIDPEDEFFLAPGASFDEALQEDVQWNRSATYQFNEVCATGGTWPGLSSSLGSGLQEIATTSISPAQPPPAAMAHSSPPHTSTSGTWGSRNHSAALKPPPKEVAKNSFPSLAESSLSMHTLRSKGRNNGGKS